MIVIQTELVVGEGGTSFISFLKKFFHLRRLGKVYWVFEGGVLGFQVGSLVNEELSNLEKSSGIVLRQVEFVEFTQSTCIFTHPHLTVSLFPEATH